MTPDANDLCVFVVKRGEIENREIYCNPLYPFYISLIEKYKHSPYYCGKMSDFLDVNPKTDCSMLTDKTEVSFVPMPNVQEKTMWCHMIQSLMKKLRKDLLFFGVMTYSIFQN